MPASKPPALKSLKGVGGPPAPPIIGNAVQPELHPTAFQPITRDFNPAWLAQYGQMGRVEREDVQRFPHVQLDHVPKRPPPHGQHFVTADRCSGCHGALEGNGFPMMLNGTEGIPDIDVSPYSDWRWTPMELAGRDPLFYAQLETEIAMVAAEHGEQEALAFADALNTTCMSCHGGPGMRQAAEDGVPFKKEFIYIDDPADENYAYGALARDGINCTMCHHIDFEGTEAEFLTNQTTGRFPLGPADTLFGPFSDDNIIPQPMVHGVGFEPVASHHFGSKSPESSRKWGHCHTINLPVIDDPASLAKGALPSEAFTGKHPTHPEQTTYPEWLNSAYQTIYDPGELAQSCQSCHMKQQHRGKEIETFIAAVQAEEPEYPETEHMLEGITLTKKQEYGRHAFVGLNVFLLQMFKQFPGILGVSFKNYMTSQTKGISMTIAKMLNQRNNSVKVDFTATKVGNEIHVPVSITNLTGHRFPSGVAFRRAWFEVELYSPGAPETVHWASGSTNSVGVTLGADGTQLKTEFFEDQQFQKHHEVITSEDPVQIYEEIAADAKGQVTYSFLRRNTDVKDNRLLPRGHTSKGPSPSIPAAVILSTQPHGTAQTPTTSTARAWTECCTKSLYRKASEKPGFRFGSRSTTRRLPQLSWRKNSSGARDNPRRSGSIT